jgi:Fic family protein
MSSKKSRFQPVFNITPAIARGLMRIEAVNHTIEKLPIPARLLANLRETARLFSTHYSTMIEGNLLTQEQVVRVIAEDHPLPGRERDQEEVRGYYAALDEVERLAQKSSTLTERSIQTLHALVMGGKTRTKPTPYRTERSVILDSRNRRIVYMPPEAQEVPALMAEIIRWINTDNELPMPLKAAIAHYQFATIHPYYDGNGRTARLLTTLILHLGGYGLKGLYALEEYYARHLKAYYEALTIGPSHNYHLGRAEADITGWIAYFIEGMATSFESVHAQATRAAKSGAGGRSQVLRTLDTKQRKVLILFKQSREVTAKEIAALFGFQQRTAAALCQQWVATGFLVVSSPSKKARRYCLTDDLESRITGL